MNKINFLNYFFLTIAILFAISYTKLTGVVALGKQNTHNTAIIHKIAAEMLDSSRLHQTKTFMQHGKISVFAHCVSVAAMSIKIANFLKLNVDKKSLIRGALLHDYFLYDWHDTNNKYHRLHGFTHPSTALKNASQDFELSHKEKDIIVHHMFPLVPIPPKCREAWIVCLADKICALDETLFHR